MIFFCICCSLLSFTIKNGKLDIFNNVLQKLPENEKKRYLNSLNTFGDTYLHLACSLGKVEFVNSLLEHGTKNLNSHELLYLTNMCFFSGADPNSVDTLGNSPIHLCILENQEQCLTTILSKSENSKINLNIRNYDGYTPLHLAIESDSLTLMKILWAADTNIFETDPRSLNTILHMAVKKVCLTNNLNQ